VSDTFADQYANRAVSAGTLREVDLITPFMDALRALDPVAASLLAEDERITMNALDGTYTADREYSEADVAAIVAGAGDFLEVLTDALDLCAPTGYRFGAAEGNASLIGFWPIEG
jgi:hypothetical protein